MSNAELATSYAALILADDGVEITADKLSTLIKAANVLDVEPIWASLFAKALEGKDVKDLLSNVGSGGGAASAPAAGGAPAAAGASEDAKVEEKVEEKEESDDDMGFGLFD
ncbi:60S acidic ribosomal protein P1 [Podospora didyma]|uniref:Large ribosomal subunit protein P1 n=1 Tax=Podospora didyma TaxID=330526 RepID=A0AAE0NBL1_9PEZI|nr:60S acidic ribosomal protein P1 [Podospora didyma]